MIKARITFWLAVISVNSIFQRYYLTCRFFLLYFFVTPFNFSVLLFILLQVSHIYTGGLDDTRGADMVSCDPDGRLMVYTTKQYPTDDTTCFHVLGRVMSGKKPNLTYFLA